MKYACLALLAFVAGCAVGPNYHRLDVETPPAYKEAGDWVVAQPKDTVPKGKWWEIFGDPTLNALEEQVDVSNQTLKAAEARYTQARATTRAARAALFPTIGASADATRSRRGGGSGSSAAGGSTGGTAGGTTGGGASIINTYSASLDAHWEADVWGRIRRQIEAARESEQASAGDVEAARLSLQAELATNYFQLRVTDRQHELLDDSVKAFRTSFNIAQNRYRVGVAGKVDVVTAETQLRSIEAQAIDLQATRAQLEHGIAILTGKAPSSFTLEPAKVEIRVPDIPPGVPSTLLERRPDIAAAERRMAAANARIGVAEAAYFPTFDFTGSAGFAGTSLAHLFSAPNRVWSLGLALADTLIDFGARSAQVESARGAYDETVANYRGTVLTAFGEVEDSLASVRWLAEELKTEEDAVRLARESVALTLNQYKAGTVGYLNVVQVQATQLSEERTAVNLLGRRLAASVALVKAIGGSWQP